MEESGAPTKLPAVWAYDATNPTYVRAVPVAPTAQLGAASFELGFPPATFEPDTAGGAGPWGADPNGILQQITAGLQWLQAGGVQPFDGTWAALPNVGGYPQYAMVRSTTFPGAWISTVDNNTNDPDTGGVDWTPVVLLASSLRAGASAATFYTYSGNNPNGQVAGTASSGAVAPDFCYTQGGSQGLWVCTSSGPASGAGQAVWVQIWNGAGSSGTLQTTANGQCRFTYTNSTTATLSAYGGGGLIINGVLQTIPVSAPTIAVGACASGPNYVYAATSGGGGMTLSASTEAYTRDSSGNPVKSDDATKTCVGWVYVAAGAFTQSLVASMFSRRSFPIQGNPQFGAELPLAPGYQDIGSGGHVPFFVWADEGVAVNLNIGALNSGDSTSITIGLGLDGSPVNLITAAAAAYNVYEALPGQLSEGLHTLSILGSCSTPDEPATLYAMLTAQTQG